MFQKIWWYLPAKFSAIEFALFLMTVRIWKTLEKVPALALFYFLLPHLSCEASSYNHAKYRSGPLGLWPSLPGLHAKETLIPLNCGELPKNFPVMGVSEGAVGTGEFL